MIIASINFLFLNQWTFFCFCWRILYFIILWCLKINLLKHSFLSLFSLISYLRYRNLDFLLSYFNIYCFNINIKVVILIYQSLKADIFKVYLALSILTFYFHFFNIHQVLTQLCLKCLFEICFSQRSNAIFARSQVFYRLISYHGFASLYRFLPFWFLSIRCCRTIRIINIIIISIASIFIIELSWWLQTTSAAVIGL